MVDGIFGNLMSGLIEKQLDFHLFLNSGVLISLFWLEEYEKI